jgi:hypothetical protein
LVKSETAATLLKSFKGFSYLKVRTCKVCGNTTMWYFWQWVGNALPMAGLNEPMADLVI